MKIDIKEVNQFVDFLRGKGFKVTPQRMRIAETVFDTHEHFTADQLFGKVKLREPLVGRVTVYRTIEHLVNSGMVEELSLKRGVSTYEHVAGHRHHDHIICTQCGKVEEIESEELERVKFETAKSMGYAMTSHTLKIFGICGDHR